MKSFENEYTKMWINDGILYVKYVPFLIVTFEIAKECVKGRVAFCEGQTYPMLGYSKSIKDFTKEARKFLASEEATKGISAGAFLIGTQIEKFMGNLWFKIDKPLLPARLFTDEMEAIAWLETYKVKNMN